MTSVHAESDALFKRADGGWIFRAPNPLIFGDASHYFVNDEQKGLIARILTPRRPFLIGVCIGIIVIAWVFLIAGLACLIGLDADKATPLQFTGMVLLFVLPVLAALPLVGIVQLRRLAPILAHAQPTTERITLREVGLSLKSSYTMGKAVRLGSIWIFASLMQLLTLAIRNDRHPLFSDFQSYMNVIGLLAGMFVAIRFFRIALARRREENTTPLG